MTRNDSKGRMGARDSARNHRSNRGLVSKSTRFVSDHPKTTAAAGLAVLAAGVGAYALMHKKKNGAHRTSSAPARGGRATGRRSSRTTGRARRGSAASADSAS